MLDKSLVIVSYVEVGEVPTALLKGKNVVGGKESTCVTSSKEVVINPVKIWSVLMTAKGSAFVDGPGLMVS